MHTLISLCSIFLRNFQGVNDGAIEHLDGAWHVVRSSDNPFTIQEYARLSFALYAFKLERFNSIIFLRAEVLEAKTGANSKASQEAISTDIIPLDVFGRSKYFPFLGRCCICLSHDDFSVGRTDWLTKFCCCMQYSLYTFPFCGMLHIYVYILVAFHFTHRAHSRLEIYNIYHVDYRFSGDPSAQCVKRNAS